MVPADDTACGDGRLGVCELLKVRPLRIGLLPLGEGTARAGELVRELGEGSGNISLLRTLVKVLLISSALLVVRGDAPAFPQNPPRRTS